jgi:hypothetical protein
MVRKGFSRDCPRFSGGRHDPDAPDTVWLREAPERKIPVTYFLGVSPGRYQAII